METLITESYTTPGHAYFKAICGKTCALVQFDDDGFVRVIVDNAAHRVWRGFGRLHRSFDEALNAYKSAEVRAILWATNAARSA